MGWKSVKEHYQIKHIVQMTSAGLCIGSPYVYDIIVVAPDGTILKRYDDKGAWSKNSDLCRYQDEIQADPNQFLQLMAEPDIFKHGIPVYTYDHDGNIIAKLCEEPKWPNITHDGEIMYDNKFSTDKLEVVGWAKRNATSDIESINSTIQQTEEKLAKYLGWKANKEAALAKLNAEFPDVACPK